MPAQPEKMSSTQKKQKSIYSLGEDLTNSISVYKINLRFWRKRLSKKYDLKE